MTEQQSPLIYKKMIAITQEIEAIDKTQTNQMQKYQFRGIDDIYNNIHSLFGKHGVFCTAVVKEYSSDVKVIQEEIQVSSRKNSKIQIRVTATFDFVFYAEDGSSVTVTLPSEGIDYGDKATNKAISAAMKYAIITVFSIPTKDLDDGDRESPTYNVNQQSTTAVLQDVENKGKIIKEREYRLHEMIHRLKEMGPESGAEYSFFETSYKNFYQEAIKWGDSSAMKELETAKNALKRLWNTVSANNNLGMAK